MQPEDKAPQNFEIVVDEVQLLYPPTELEPVAEYDFAD